MGEQRMMKGLARAVVGATTVLGALGLGLGFGADAAGADQAVAHCEASAAIVAPTVVRAAPGTRFDVGPRCLTQLVACESIICMVDVEGAASTSAGSSAMRVTLYAYFLPMPDAPSDAEPELVRLKTGQCQTTVNTVTLLQPPSSCEVSLGTTIMPWKGCAPLGGCTHETTYYVECQFQRVGTGGKAIWGATVDCTAS